MSYYLEAPTISEKEYYLEQVMFDSFQDAKIEINKYFGCSLPTEVMSKLEKAAKEKQDWMMQFLYDEVELSDKEIAAFTWNKTRMYAILDAINGYEDFID